MKCSLLNSASIVPDGYLFYHTKGSSNFVLKFLDRYASANREDALFVGISYFVLKLRTNFVCLFDLMLYIHIKQLRSCQNSQWRSSQRQFTSTHSFSIN